MATLLPICEMKSTIVSRDTKTMNNVASYRCNIVQNVEKAKYINTMLVIQLQPKTQKTRWISLTGSVIEECVALVHAENLVTWTSCWTVIDNSHLLIKTGLEISDQRTQNNARTVWMP